MHFSSATIAALFVHMLAKIALGDECVDPHNLVRAGSCCKVHTLYPDEFAKECSEEYGHLIGSGDQLGWSMCLAKCIMEKSGAVVGDTIHVEALYKYADYFNESIRQAYRSAIDHCVKQNFKRTHYDASWKCDPLSVDINGCLLTMLIRTCPQELRRDAEPCAKMRAGVPLCE